MIFSASVIKIIVVLNYGAVQIFLSFLYQITHLALFKSLVTTSPNVGLDSSKMNAISQLLNKVDIELLEELKN